MQGLNSTSTKLVHNQGAGTMRFFGLKIYDIWLWTAQATNNLNYCTTPLALELQYARHLEGKLIAERSIVEMRRVDSFNDDEARRWQCLMEKAFPDVVANDRLIGVFDGDETITFFHNNNQTAQIEDAKFAQLFLGIWLSAKTSAPQLRQQLMGA